VTCHRQRRKQCTINNWRGQLKQLDPNNTASGEPGAIHTVVEATLETAIENVSLAILENRTLRNAEAAWDAWQQVLAHLDGEVSRDAVYGTLVTANRNADFGDV
jgi:hypothetical protein